MCRCRFIYYIRSRCRRSDSKMQMSQHIYRPRYIPYLYIHIIYIQYIYILLIYLIYTQYNIVYIYIRTLVARPTTTQYITHRGEGEGAVGVRALLIDFKYLLRLYSESFLRASRTKNTVTFRRRRVRIKPNRR